MYMCSNVLDPMAQDIPEQDIVMGEQELPPQMDPKPKMAAVCDTSPPLPHHNPPPIPAETAHPGALDRDQIYRIWQTTGGMNDEIKTVQQMKEEIKKNIDAQLQMMQGEMRQVGQWLHAGIMAALRAEMSELKGSAPAGEDRVIRETRRTRHEVTEERKLNGVTETCTVRHQVTELTETMETVVERLHGEKDAHTHTQR